MNTIQFFDYFKLAEEIYLSQDIMVKIEKEVREEFPKIFVFGISHRESTFAISRIFPGEIGFAEIFKNSRLPPNHTHKFPCMRFSSYSY